MMGTQGIAAIAKRTALAVPEAKLTIESSQMRVSARTQTRMHVCTVLTIYDPERG